MVEMADGETIEVLMILLHSMMFPHRGAKCWLTGPTVSATTLCPDCSVHFPVAVAPNPPTPLRSADLTGNLLYQALMIIDEVDGKRKTCAGGIACNTRKEALRSLLDRLSLKIDDRLVLVPGELVVERTGMLRGR